MKSQQLANVLIKILGLSILAHGIPNLVSSLIGLVQFASDNRSFNTSHSQIWLMILYILPSLVIGLALIFGSRWLAEVLFKNEAD